MNEFVTKCLQKNPRDRPTARQLLEVSSAIVLYARHGNCRSGGKNVRVNILIRDPGV